MRRNSAGPPVVSAGFSPQFCRCDRSSVTALQCASQECGSQGSPHLAERGKAVGVGGHTCVVTALWFGKILVVR